MRRSSNHATCDDVFTLLGDGRRRLTLRYLVDRTGSGPIDVGYLAAAVASMETADAIDRLDGDAGRGATRDPDAPCDYDVPRDYDAPLDPPAVERVSISLAHVHLPKLADAGVVEYDADARTVEFSGIEGETIESLRRVERLAGKLAGIEDRTPASG
ncbi:hypothetical protein Hbl1158_10445 [Halobaculum sp. CBA1158]|uniref:DUF7344 domain-containing protein n=1 Tax=Halobaculum sp. CBA1158 TaxID=2904243 RepID=UPI001F3D22CB|nr:hypothetical protein [Halobaculum sp. CBA1158]UIO98953.1 hypothetical protein Hbl1158_10445 [Halobaculum sp. CBA1158]